MGFVCRFIVTCIIHLLAITFTEKETISISKILIHLLYLLRQYVQRQYSIHPSIHQLLTSNINYIKFWQTDFFSLNNQV